MSLTKMDSGEKRKLEDIFAMNSAFTNGMIKRFYFMYVKVFNGKENNRNLFIKEIEKNGSDIDAIISEENTAGKIKTLYQLIMKLKNNLNIKVEHNVLKQHQEILSLLHNEMLNYHNTSHKFNEDETFTLDLVTLCYSFAHNYQNLYTPGEFYFVILFFIRIHVELFNNKFSLNLMPDNVELVYSLLTKVNNKSIVLLSKNMDKDLFVFNIFKSSLYRKLIPPFQKFEDENSFIAQQLLGYDVNMRDTHGFYFMGIEDVKLARHLYLTVLGYFINEDMDKICSFGFAINELNPSLKLETPSNKQINATLISNVIKSKQELMQSELHKGIVVYLEWYIQIKEPSNDQKYVLELIQKRIINSDLMKEDNTMVYKQRVTIIPIKDRQESAIGNYRRELSYFNYRKKHEGLMFDYIEFNSEYKDNEQEPNTKGIVLKPLLEKLSVFEMANYFKYFCYNISISSNYVYNYKSEDDGIVYTVNDKYQRITNIFSGIEVYIYGEMESFLLINNKKFWFFGDDVNDYDELVRGNSVNNITGTNNPVNNRVKICIYLRNISETLKISDSIPLIYDNTIDHIKYDVFKKNNHN